MPAAFCCAGIAAVVVADAPVFTSVPKGSGMVTSALPAVVDSSTETTALPLAWPESRKTGLATTLKRALVPIGMEASNGDSSAER